MREKQKVLIATTNDGKFKEILHVLEDLPFDFLSLSEMDQGIQAPEENDPTIFGNAVIKATAYAKQFGIITLADDSGLFIDALNGWPGVVSARIAENNEARNALVLEKLRDLPADQRGATFRAAIAVCDPKTGSILTSSGEIRGSILSERVQANNGFGYDPIFFVPTAGKTFAEMTLAEKNTISHRGQALFNMKYILQNEYGGRHIVVPVAIILHEGKVLLAKRNDPFRPAFHGKWEFPGGRMDIGETIEENLIREAQEEVGYLIEPIKRLSTIWVEHQTGEGWAYQVYLIPYACSILKKIGEGSDAEVMEQRWCTPEDVLTMELVGANKKMYTIILPEIQQLLNVKH